MIFKVLTFKHFKTQRNEILNRNNVPYIIFFRNQIISSNTIITISKYLVFTKTTCQVSYY